jgi:hypothetical protein
VADPCFVRPEAYTVFGNLFEEKNEPTKLKKNKISSKVNIYLELEKKSQLITI